MCPARIYVCYLLVRRLLQSKAAAEVLPLAEGLASDPREHAQVIDLPAWLDWLRGSFVRVGFFGFLCGLLSSLARTRRALAPDQPLPPMGRTTGSIELEAPRLPFSG